MNFKEIAYFRGVIYQKLKTGIFFVLLCLFNNAFSQEVKSGVGWVSTSGISTQTSPPYSGGSCSNITYDFSITSGNQYRRFFSPAPYNSDAIIMPAVINNPATSINFSILFSQPVYSLSIRIIDLDENGSTIYSDPEEFLSGINPPPDGITTISGINRYFLSGTIVSPFDSDPLNDNNNTAGWLNWNGPLNKVDIIFNRPGPGYGLIIDSIYFNCQFAIPCSIAVDLGPDQIICDTAAIDITATSIGATSYLWDDNSGGTNRTVETSGAYWVEVSNGACTDRDTINITYNSISVDLGPDQIICDASAIDLTATNIGAISYLWDDNSNGMSRTVQTTGTYWVEVSDGSCTALDTVNITYNSISVDLGPDQIICDTAAIDLTAASIGAISYLWDDNSNGISRTVQTTGTYWVEANNGVCTDRDTVKILHIDLQQEFMNDAVLCENIPILLDATDPMAISYQWSTGAISGSITVNQPGSYIVSRYYGACVQTDTVIITQIDLANEYHKQTGCQGESLLLSTGMVSDNYSWSNGSQESTITVDETGIYVASIQNTCGTSYFTYEVTFENCYCSVYLPNTFTPNGNELNEIYKVVYDCELHDFTMEIYDRWGKLIFESHNPGIGWDGTYNGLLVQDGSYTYKMSYRMGKNQEKKHYAGHVNVIK